MARIKIIEPDKATGDLKTIYDGLAKSRGKIAEVHKMQSLHPQSIADHMNFYMTIMFSKSPLKRYQREMMAVIVSAANLCKYCIRHHAEALLHYWKDENRLEKLIRNYQLADLDDTDELLCRFAQTLTLKPAGNEQEQLADAVKTQLGDRSLLDASLVVSYFNFVNRMVNSLGIELEDEPGGYNY